MWLRDGCTSATAQSVHCGGKSIPATPDWPFMAAYRVQGRPGCCYCSSVQPSWCSPRQRSLGLPPAAAVAPPPPPPPPRRPRDPRLQEAGGRVPSLHGLLEAGHHELRWPCLWAGGAEVHFIPRPGEQAHAPRLCTRSCHAAACPMQKRAASVHAAAPLGRGAGKQPAPSR